MDTWEAIRSRRNVRSFAEGPQGLPSRSTHPRDRPPGPPRDWSAVGLRRRCTDRASCGSWRRCGRGPAHRRLGRHGRARPAATEDPGERDRCQTTPARRRWRDDPPGRPRCSARRHLRSATRSVASEIPACRRTATWPTCSTAAPGRRARQRRSRAPNRRPSTRSVHRWPSAQPVDRAAGRLTPPSTASPRSSRRPPLRAGAAGDDHLEARPRPASKARPTGGATRTTSHGPRSRISSSSFTRPDPERTT